MNSNEALAKTIEALCGLPLVPSHHVTTKIALSLVDLKAAINEVANSKDCEGYPFGSLEGRITERNFIRAAAHYFPTETERLAGLATAQPPDGIHRMQRSDPWWVGDFFSANMVIHALRACGLEKAEARVLDIGCSSGSLVRVLGAYARNWKLYGRDPIRSAADWAAGNIPCGNFAPMNNKPPLDFEDGTLDGATAISVWSHHRPDAAKIWLAEVARVLKPGGWFVVTFSGLNHLLWSARKGIRPFARTLAMLNDVCTAGSSFYTLDYKGEENETGSDWGQCCYSREFFYGMCLEKFDIAGHFRGLNQGNQDVAVLVKR